MKAYRPLIMMLLESKISGLVADEVCKRLGTNRWGQSAAVGFNGGIWVLWDEGEMRIDFKHVQKIFVHLLVTHGDGQQ